MPVRVAGPSLASRAPRRREPGCVGAEESPAHGVGRCSEPVPGNCIGISTVTTEGSTIRTSGFGGTTLTVCLKLRAWPSRLIGSCNRRDAGEQRLGTGDPDHVGWAIGRAARRRCRLADQAGETFNIWLFSRSSRRGMELGSMARTSSPSGAGRCSRRAGHRGFRSPCRKLRPHVHDVRRERADLPIRSAQPHLDRLDGVENEMRGSGCR